MHDALSSIDIDVVINLLTSFDRLNAACTALPPENLVEDVCSTYFLKIGKVAKPFIANMTEKPPKSAGVE